MEVVYLTHLQMSPQTGSDSQNTFQVCAGLFQNLTVGDTPLTTFGFIQILCVSCDAKLESKYITCITSSSEK